MFLVPGMIPVAVVSELVLYLSHDDRPPVTEAALELEVSHPREELLQVDLGPLLIGRVGAPEEHGVVVEQPAGQPAELPLPADVGPGPEYGEHVLLLDHLQKSSGHFI